MKRYLLPHFIFVGACGACLVTLASCSGGACHDRRTTASPATLSSQESGALAADDRVRGESVWVFKYDGSKQCDKTPGGTTLETTAKELAPLLIKQSKKKSDGLMHVQECGTPTGKANVYLIARSDLEAALKKGFKEWLYD